MDGEIKDIRDQDIINKLNTLRELSLDDIDYIYHKYSDRYQVVRPLLECKNIPSNILCEIYNTYSGGLSSYVKKITSRHENLSDEHKIRITLES